ncbi:MAG: Nif3-like dinuclear metal center hexameric protein [Sphingobacteriales bacterium]|nr:Nif3-like dinuclear metal center hexameric protein [Sphingobacteriales bacterium]
MKVKEIIKILEDWAPLHYQEDYDNSGLQVGNPDMEVTGISICLEITDEILEDAIQSNYNLIISHHPLIFRGLKKINYLMPENNVLIKAIKHDICIYSCHTNLDNIRSGVNQKLAGMLELEDIEILRPFSGRLFKITVFCPDIRLSDGSYVPENVRNAMFEAGAGKIGEYDSCSFNVEGTGTFKPLETANPFIGKTGITEYQKEIRVETIVPIHQLNRVVDAMIDAHPYEEVAYDIYPLANEFPLAGSGIIGNLVKPMAITEFLALVKERFRLKMIRHNCFHEKIIKRVALCGGAGSFLIHDAVSKSADIFLTGDLKYHDFTSALGKIVLADIGHFESEQFSSELIYDYLKENISTFAALKIKQNFNPINYF